MRTAKRFLRPLQRSIVADSLSYACVHWCAIVSWCVPVSVESNMPLHSFCRRSVGLQLIVIVPGSSAGWQLYCRSFRTVRYAFALASDCRCKRSAAQQLAAQQQQKLAVSSDASVDVAVAVAVVVKLVDFVVYVLVKLSALVVSVGVCLLLTLVAVRNFYLFSAAAANTL